MNDPIAPQKIEVLGSDSKPIKSPSKWQKAKSSFAKHVAIIAVVVSIFGFVVSISGFVFTIVIWQDNRRIAKESQESSERLAKESREATARLAHRQNKSEFNGMVQQADDQFRWVCEGVERGIKKTDEFFGREVPTEAESLVQYLGDCKDHIHNTLQNYEMLIPPDCRTKMQAWIEGLKLSIPLASLNPLAVSKEFKKNCDAAKKDNAKANAEWVKLKDSIAEFLKMAHAFHEGEKTREQLNNSYGRVNEYALTRQKDITNRHALFVSLAEINAKAATLDLK